MTAAAAWTAVLEVRPEPGCRHLRGKEGAFIHLGAWTTTALGLRRRAIAWGRDWRLRIVEVEDILRWGPRRALGEGGATELVRLVRQTKALQVYRFHTYPRDDGDGLKQARRTRSRGARPRGGRRPPRHRSGA